MTAGDILRQQAKARGHTDEQIAYAENIVRTVSPGYLEREISDLELAEFLATSKVIQNMPTTELLARAERYVAKN